MSRKAWTSVAAMLAVAATGGVARADTPAPGAGGFRCEAGDTRGLPPEDAKTAVDIVCREVASVSRSAGAYSVSIRPLGPSIVLTVAATGAANGRSLILDGFGEVPTAARRLAEALVLDKPIEETRQVDNLVASEGRKLVTRSGSRKFELGAVGMAAGKGTGTGGGFSFGFAYDTPTFAIPAELRFAHSSVDERSLGLFSVDTGARRFLSRGDTSPFVGGGFSVMYLSLSDSRYQGRYVYVEDSHWGPGLYAEAGVQILRMHRGRMTAKVRADFPVFSMHPQGTDYEVSGRGTRPVAVDEGQRYVVPVTFGLTMSF